MTTHSKNRADDASATPETTRSLGRRSFIGAASTIAVTTAVAGAVEKTWQPAAQADAP